MQGKFARWILRLQPYPLDIAYCPGSTNQLPDSLSRIPIVCALIDNQELNVNSESDDVCAPSQCVRPLSDTIDWVQCDDCNKWFHIDCAKITKQLAEQIGHFSCQQCKRENWQRVKNQELQATINSPLQPLIGRSDLIKAQNSDESIQLLLQSGNDTDTVNDMIMHFVNGHWKVVVPKCLTTYILSLCHDHPIAGHMGRNKTLNRIVDSKLWWKNMSSDVRNYVRSCKVCQVTKPRTSKPQGNHPPHGNL